VLVAHCVELIRYGQILPTATASVGLIASGQWVSLIVAEDFQGFDAVAPSRAIAAQVLQS
jgi:hypothetical protein